MLKQGLLFLALLVAAILVRAPATVWDESLRRLSHDQLALIDAQGSLWHGEARLAVRDPEDGARIPLTPIRWRWQPLDLLRARVSWSMSVAGLPAFALSASPMGVAANSVAIQLPVRAVLDQIPNTLARAGWRGDFSLNIERWQCNWRRLCNGHAELFWRGAASDLFPGRQFGNYHLAVEGQGADIQLRLDTLNGEVLLNGSGRISPQEVQLQGTVEGDPAFVGRLPAVAGRWVQRSATPGKMLLNFNSRAR